ncbi:MAG TPA: hydroxyacid dehydrogenase [Xanthobacteraceae bacterium]|jgi:D-3-phosphoglycerate dehydrogenase|nr:hydroxyacid dehydrogenase [Xanthobacteraceae bacterium]
MPHAVNNKRVFCVQPHRPIGFGEMLGARGDIRLDMLEQKSPDQAAMDVLSAAHAYQMSSARDELAAHYHARAELLGRAPNLLIVSTNGAGYDTVDIKACTGRGVLVVNQSGGNAEAVAEHVLGMMLCLIKRVPDSDRALRAGTIKNRNDYTGNEALGRTLGIVGLGNVGRRVAELAGILFKMTVLAYDPYVSAEVAKSRGAEKVELDELLKRADFVSINCPLTPETRKLIGGREFALMKPDAFFITTARGSIHDEEALERALRDKKLAGAGLDVWEKEPPAASHPLMQYDNVMVTPHMAGVTKEARIRMGRIAAEQMLDALDGKPVPRIVNPQVWPDYAKRFEQTFGFAPAPPPDEPNWHAAEKHG